MKFFMWYTNILYSSIWHNTFENSYFVSTKTMTHPSYNHFFSQETARWGKSSVSVFPIRNYQQNKRKKENKNKSYYYYFEINFICTCCVQSPSYWYVIRGDIDLDWWQCDMTSGLRGIAIQTFQTWESKKKREKPTKRTCDFGSI